MMKFAIALSVILGAFAPPLSTPVAAADRKPAATSDRQKSIDFEEEAVEQVNRDPLDSVENLAQRDTHGGTHLYRKTLHFHPEMKRLGKDLRRMP
ncbi:MAG: hypothetical protein AAB425_01070 [Bdellovibrionota bacterium]